MRIALNDKTSKLISSAIGISSQSVERLDFISIKAGMTNTSFLFQTEENGKKYILRIPGPGADKLINRSAESEAYSAIKGKGICPDLLLLDATSGIKLSEFLDDIQIDLRRDPRRELQRDILVRVGAAVMLARF